jgi:hypothetical protein
MQLCDKIGRTCTPNRTAPGASARAWPSANPPASTGKTQKTFRKKIIKTSAIALVNQTISLAEKPARTQPQNQAPRLAKRINREPLHREPVNRPEAAGQA